MSATCTRCWLALSRAEGLASRADMMWVVMPGCPETVAGVGTPEAASQVSFYGQELERSLFFFSNSGMQSESGRGPDLKTTAGVKLKLHSVASHFTRHADRLINASRPTALRQDTRCTSVCRTRNMATCQSTSLHAQYLPGSFHLQLTSHNKQRGDQGGEPERRPEGGTKEGRGGNQRGDTSPQVLVLPSWLGSLRQIGTN